MRPTDPDTNQLVQRAAEGDPAAAQQLLRRHRARLRRMVALRMDPRLAARIDPSDGVQDALIEAHNPLPQYLAERRIPFYPWLRRLAWNRLVALYRQHVQSGRRSVTREQTSGPPLSEESVMQLVDRLAGSGTSPGDRLLREEMRQRVRAALDELSPSLREVLVLRFLEQLPVRDAAAVMRITEGAFKTRQVRALQQLRRLLKHDVDE